MRLTVLDVQSREFGRTFRGYSPPEVDAFRQEVADSLEEAHVEASLSRNEVARVRDEIARYQDLEKNLNDALVLAQRSAEEARANARREADLIVRDAENEAREIVARARAERATLERDIRDIEDCRARLIDELSASVYVIQQKLDVMRARAGAIPQGEAAPANDHADPAPAWLSGPPDAPTGTRDGG